jgi:hypothetical protein
MDTSALVATLTSVMALGLAVVTARLVRQERQRSDARVTMLASLAAEAPFAPPLRLEPRTRQAAPATRAPRVVAASVADIEILRDASPVAPVAPELFEPAPARTGVSLLYVFLAAVVMAALIAGAFRWALPASTPAPTSETTAVVGAPAAPQPLSLVSLRHEQHPDGTLVISGVVRNPPGASARERLFAAASLLDAEGAVIATARAPLDFTSLAGGDESPFVVRVGGATGVARYRVGFRDASGASVAHVDGR